MGKRVEENVEKSDLTLHFIGMANSKEYFGYPLFFFLSSLFKYIKQEEEKTFLYLSLSSSTVPFFPLSPSQSWHTIQPNWTTKNNHVFYEKSTAERQKPYQMWKKPQTQVKTSNTGFKFEYGLVKGLDKIVIDYLVHQMMASVTVR